MLCGQLAVVSRSAFIKLKCLNKRHEQTWESECLLKQFWFHVTSFGSSERTSDDEVKREEFEPFLYRTQLGIKMFQSARFVSEIDRRLVGS